MKFTATTTFLHGTERYEEGKEYEEPSALAGYFIGCGWASSDSKTAEVLQPQTVTLDIQSGSSNHKAGEV